MFEKSRNPEIDERITLQDVKMYYETIIIVKYYIKYPWKEKKAPEETHAFVGTFSMIEKGSSSNDSEKPS